MRPSGQARTRNTSSAFADGLALDQRLGLSDDEARAFVQDARMQVQHLAGHHEGAQLGFLTVARKGIFSKRLRARISQPVVWAIASMSRTPGMMGWPGKCPSKMELSCGTSPSH